MLSLSFPTAEVTTRHAQSLARVLNAGDVILLSGEVGAGKTHFARALIQSLLETPEDVPSPTFTLVQTYETPKGEIWHADLYRLSSTQEIEELGLTEALMPENALHLHLEDGADENARRATLRWTDDKWKDKLTAWQTT
jgi:tRNA threonylcarbamoyladenosine biosynthesis protein TsaE